LRFACDICGNKYRYSASLSKHRKLTHKLEPITYVWVHDSELSARERQDILVRNFKRKQQRIENKGKKTSDPQVSEVSHVTPSVISAGLNTSTSSATVPNGATPMASTTAAVSANLAVPN